MADEIDAPVSLGGMFADSSDSEGEAFEQVFEEQALALGGETLRVRQFAFHGKNANRVWPGAMALAERLQALLPQLSGLRVLELGAATGAVSVWMARRGLQVVTSDVAGDEDGTDEVAANIAFNCGLNGVDPPPPHVPHTWGQPWPAGAFDVVVASDILLYVDAYSALVGTLQQAMGPEGSLVMAWKRRLKGSRQFFEMMHAAGFVITDEGGCVYTMRQGGVSALAAGRVCSVEELPGLPA